MGLAVITLICASLVGETRPAEIAKGETPAEAAKVGAGK